ncbi:MAG: hypothetical protein IKB04_06505 [Clostridia bacterium]|nr:hypothetical protein [Clostridia bacterium]
MKCCKHLGVGTVVAVSAMVAAATAAATVLMLVLCKHSDCCDELCECTTAEPCPNPTNEE